jgi:formylglycine-generating enzyme required for sulfatase activity
LENPGKGRIFISYRRADSAGYAGRIYDRLSAHFGEDAIFMDVTKIEAGVDFVAVLQNAVQSCDVLVALIGRRWLNIKDETGERRLDNPEDFVRVEVAAALDRDIRVIPVYVDDAPMLRSTELPNNLKPLARRNALQVNHPSFNEDTYRLISQLELALKAAEDSNILKAQATIEEHARLAAEQKAKLEREDREQKGLEEKTRRWIKELSAKIPFVVWFFLLGIIITTSIGFFYELELRCLLEWRLNEAVAVLIIAFLGAISAVIFSLVPSETKNMFRGFGVGVFIVILLFAIKILSLPPLPYDECFPIHSPTPTGTPTLVPSSTLSTTVAPIETPVSTLTPIPTNTTEPQTSSTPEELGVGSTMISEKDGMVMVYVPAGEFQMGSDPDEALAECQKFNTDCQRDWFTDEEPIHTVDLNAYWIDQTEVTNAMYVKCVKAGACDPPDESESYTHDSYYGDSEYNDYPVMYVSWNDAIAYCEWVDRRLPTEAEWEKAAIWDEDSQAKRLYPWGNSFDGTKVNFCDTNCTYDWKIADYNDGYEDVSPVGNYPAGSSFFGAYDMAGNVWEWMSDWYDSGYYSKSPGSNPTGPLNGDFRVLRGSAWDGSNISVRPAGRFWRDPTNSNDLIGFRCARGADLPY